MVVFVNTSFAQYFSSTPQNHFSVVKFKNLKASKNQILQKKVIKVSDDCIFCFLTSLLDCLSILFVCILIHHSSVLFVVNHFLHNPDAFTVKKELGTL